ncbi:MAG: putative transporter component [Chitinophagaceae bacterium]|nr:putative transporter component [Chitinophagaceae bacterium]MDB5224075.1 putative transporter component [Chitinophagaceae bacterium]
MEIFNVLRQPWPWYIAGPIIGLSVPLLLLAGNKMLGISGTLRQVCAMCFPANIPFLKYKWKDQIWNIFFAGGLLLGGFIGGVLLKPVTIPPISDATLNDLKLMGISYEGNILPTEIFSWIHLLTWQNLLIVVGGGFLVGFGTRYAGGCTSGHGIAGLSTLQWPSFVAVVLFFASGILTANFILPLLLK